MYPKADIGNDEKRLRKMKQKKFYGFTLIELLIVVAIIGILAAIAVPNFMSAMVRAKVARTQEESRVLFLALEAYRIDHNMFPNPSGQSLDPLDLRGRFYALTTPVSYMTSTPNDPFSGKYDNGAGLIDLREVPGGTAYCYGRADMAGQRGTLNLGKSFGMIASAGPDGQLAQIYYYPPHITHTGGADCPVCDPALAALLTVTEYSPSNGLISGGDIYRWSSKSHTE